jgi:hypothetical protein
LDTATFADIIAKGVANAKKKAAKTAPVKA